MPLDELHRAIRENIRDETSGLDHLAIVIEFWVKIVVPMALGHAKEIVESLAVRVIWVMLADVPLAKAPRRIALIVREDQDHIGSRAGGLPMRGKAHPQCDQGGQPGVRVATKRPGISGQHGFSSGMRFTVAHSLLQFRRARVRCR